MANIFTIKIGSPNLLNSPLLDGELGFHLTNNTLYIGSSNGTVPIGGAGAFVPFNEDKTISVKGLTLTDPLQPEYGGTGTTDLGTLAFVTSQITDLNEQGFLKNENLKEIGFSENEGIWSLDIGSLTMGGEEVATQSWVEGLTSVVLKNYLPLTGGTITNSLTVQNQLFLTNDLTHNVNSGAVRHLFSSKDNTDNSGQIYYYGSSSFFGFQVANARGTNGANARIMYICSEKDQSSLNNFIRINNITNGTNHYYDVYHSGWNGDIPFPNGITLGSTDNTQYNTPRIYNGGSYVDLRSYRGDSTSWRGLRINGKSNDNDVFGLEYFINGYSNLVYTTKSIIYSSNEPSGSNGMIWLKPA